MASIRYASQLLPPALYEQCLPYVKRRLVYFDSPLKKQLAIQRVRVIVMFGQGVTVTAIAKHLGIARITVYRYLWCEGLLPTPVKWEKYVATKNLQAR